MCTLVPSLSVDHTTQRPSWWTKTPREEQRLEVAALYSFRQKEATFVRQRTVTGGWAVVYLWVWSLPSPWIWVAINSPLLLVASCSLSHCESLQPVLYEHFGCVALQSPVYVHMYVHTGFHRAAPFACLSVQVGAYYVYGQIFMLTILCMGDHEVTNNQQ